MKTKIALFFALMLTLPAFAQLNKAVVEANFPLLTLPYQLATKDVPTMSPEMKGWVDYKKFPYLKGNVTAIINKALINESTKKMDEKFHKKMIDYDSSKIHAIGRIETPIRTFIMYNLNLYLEKSGSYDVIYVASLDKDYKVVDISNILQYLVKVEPKVGTLQTVIIKDAFLNKDNLLTLKETFHFAESIDQNGAKKVMREVSAYGTIFLEDGKTMSALVF